MKKKGTVINCIPICIRTHLLQSTSANHLGIKDAHATPHTLTHPTMLFYIFSLICPISAQPYFFHRLQTLSKKFFRLLHSHASNFRSSSLLTVLFVSSLQTPSSAHRLFFRAGCIKSILCSCIELMLSASVLTLSLNSGYRDEKNH